MIVILQAILTVAEMVGAFFWIKLFVREQKNSPGRKAVLFIGVGLIALLTILQRNAIMYSRWYLIICILLYSLVCFAVYGGQLICFFAVSLYFETTYCLDLFQGIAMGLYLDRPDFMAEQQFALYPERVLIYLISRGILAGILIMCYANFDKVRNYLVTGGKWWYVIPFCEHLFLYGCDRILSNGKQNKAILSWQLSLLVCVIFLLTFAVYHIFKMKQSMSALIKMQSALYDRSMEDSCKRASEKERLFHDMKNHLIIMRGLLLEGETEHLEAYMDRLYQPFGADEKYTGRKTVDYLLSEKCSLAESRDIQVEMDCGRFSGSGDSVQDMDWAALLGNLWDNAIEGCERAENGKRIVFRMYQKANAISICLENSCSEWTEKMGIRSMKEGDGMHGIGMRSMQLIVNKYHGTLEWKCEKRIFRVRIHLYL